MGPGDQVGPVHPQAEWTWSTTPDGDVALAHGGGDTIERDSLRFLGDALAGSVTNLGDRDDERIVQPFENGDVSRGDSILIGGDALEDASVVLYWEASDGDQGATLASLAYPEDLDGGSRSTPGA